MLTRLPVCQLHAAAAGCPAACALPTPFLLPSEDRAPQSPCPRAASRSSTSLAAFARLASRAPSLPPPPHITPQCVTPHPITPHHIAAQRIMSRTTTPFVLRARPQEQQGHQRLAHRAGAASVLADRPAAVDPPGRARALRQRARPRHALKGAAECVPVSGWAVARGWGHHLDKPGGPAWKRRRRACACDKPGFPSSLVPVRPRGRCTAGALRADTRRGGCRRFRPWRVGRS